MLSSGSYRNLQKKAGAVVDFRSPDPAKKAPPAAEPDSQQRLPIGRSQRPNTSHNRMITGIGTPSSQSRIPFPTFASLKSSDGFKNADARAMFRHVSEGETSDGARDQPSASSPH